MKNTLLVTLLLCLLPGVSPLAESWQLQNGSALTFNATQQRAEFEGRFTQFSAQIDFDPANPAAGTITADVELGSVDTDYSDRDEYLRDTEWFYIAMWPTARFTAEEIVATDVGFVANGELSLRGVSKPVQLAFTFVKDGTRARMQGSADLLRLDFGVGTGDWADTKWVGNEVTVKFDLQLDCGCGAD